MFRNRKALLLILFIAVIFSLLAALMPVSDLDNDGFLDSLITEGFLLLPVLCCVTGLISLLIRIPRGILVAPPVYSTLLLPPPILAR